MVFNDILKYSSISDTEYNPSDNPNFLFHAGADTLNLYDYFIFFHV